MPIFFFKTALSRLPSEWKVSGPIPRLLLLQLLLTGPTSVLLQVSGCFRRLLSAAVACWTCGSSVCSMQLPFAALG